MHMAGIQVVQVQQRRPPRKPKIQPLTPHMIERLPSFFLETTAKVLLLSSAGCCFCAHPDELAAFWKMGPAHVGDKGFTIPICGAGSCAGGARVCHLSGGDGADKGYVPAVWPPVPQGLHTRVAGQEGNVPHVRTHSLFLLPGRDLLT